MGGKKVARTITVLVYSDFEEMDEVYQGVCNESTGYTILCFYSHKKIVSTLRLGPLTVTGKLYQWITVKIPGIFIGNQVKLHFGIVKSLRQLILKGALITPTSPGQSSLSMHPRDDSLEVQIMKGNTPNYLSTAEHGLYFWEADKLLLQSHDYFSLWWEQPGICQCCCGGRILGSTDQPCLLGYVLSLH